MKKMPPIQKILEAYTAIVDKHVELKNNEALVTSSNGAKTYTVSCEDNIYHSNDNATYWQGYAGYPIIAVLMLQGKIPFDQKLADNFASVNWNEVNAKFKRNYAKAASEVIKEKRLDEKEVMAELEKVYRALKDLPITIKRGALRPPKASK
jgi:riboflavin biosynthesis pyrimidine reductase